MRQSWHQERGRAFHRSDSMFYFSVFFPHRLPAINWLCPLRRSPGDTEPPSAPVIWYPSFFLTYHIVKGPLFDFLKCWPGADLTASDKEIHFVVMLCCYVKTHLYQPLIMTGRRVNEFCFFLWCYWSQADGFSWKKTTWYILCTNSRF